MISKVRVQGYFWHTLLNELQQWLTLLSALEMTKIGQNNPLLILQSTLILVCIFYSWNIHNIIREGVINIENIWSRSTKNICAEECLTCSLHNIVYIYVCKYHFS